MVLSDIRRDLLLLADRTHWQAAATLIIEHGVTSRGGAMARLMRRVYADKLEKIAPHFDAAFYLRQIRSPTRRRRILPDPLLHYFMIGWREEFSPNDRFDPRYYKGDICADALTGDPLLHFLEQANAANLPQNEVEVSTPHAAPSSASRKNALVFNHSRGGGSTEYLTWFEGNLRSAGITSRRLRLVTHSDRLVIWTHDDGRRETFNLRQDADRLVTLFADAGITHVIVNHFVDFHPSMQDLVVRIVDTLGIPLWVLLHDYFAFCPRVNLIGAGGRPCNAIARGLCQDCLAGSAKELGRDPATWTEKNLAFLARADRLVVPSNDMRGRIAPLVGHERIKVEHPEIDAYYGTLRRPSLGKWEDLRVVVLGSLNVAKGSVVILELARAIKRRHAPLKLSVIGYAENSRELKEVGVTLTGRYRSHEAPDLIETHAPHLIMLPAIWPETWSFALTNALKARIPVVVFAHGAQAERLRRLGLDDLILPLDLIGKPDALLDAFLKMRQRYVVSDGVARAASA